ncbi:helix-turn-helix domain-containing protein [Aquimarina sp. BL5]|uniref:helix-turn-helix domain-containing protein n=1 Tax=Aquimarina sp. BL5 TaxID=1714860 RepID=UPI000E4ABF38|nr:helix-turn-helix domain-containing protein [Aquimarina sp. BL5]AXT52081.1 helix-turn-helix domain-containing protein [Aquimarina sp. BL5]RKM89789.1 helix-turn-helix domain-containing protein [Aquimarina sp. BL5]
MRILLYIILVFIPFSLVAQNELDTITTIKEARFSLSVDSIPKYQQLSVEAHQKGDFKAFKEYCDAILEIANKHELDDLKNQALVNLGIYYSNVDQLDKAIEKYLEVSDNLSKLPQNKRAELIVLANLGNLYNKIEEYDKAIATMKEVVELALTVDQSEHYLMMAYNALGIAASIKKEYCQSVEYSLKAKDLAVKLNRKGAIISILLNLSDSFLALEEYDKVVFYCKEILVAITEEDSKKQKATALILIGDALVRNDKPTEAFSYLIEARDLAVSGNFFKIRKDAHKLLAKVYEAKGDFKKSLEEQKYYTEANGEYLNTLSKAQKKQLEIESEEKTELLTEQTQELKFLAREKQVYLILGCVLLILLIGSFIIYKKRRKRLVSESLRLKADKELLTNEKEALQVKLKRIAKSTKKEKDTNVTSYQNSSLTLDDRKLYMQQILDYMDNKKPYLNHEIKQSDIANDLSMSVHLFSEVLNVCFHRNFNSFINLYRVSEAKSLMKNPKYRQYKILSIGYEAGFSSKTSFNRVFKNLVGSTPSEYQKQHIVLD